MGVVLEVLKEKNGAMLNYERVLKGREEQLGKDHPKTIAVRERLHGLSKSKHGK